MTLIPNLMLRNSKRRMELTGPTLQMDTAGNLQGGSPETGRRGLNLIGLNSIIVWAITASGMVATVASPALAHGAQVRYQVMNQSSGPVVRISAEYDTATPMNAAQVSIYRPGDPQTPWVSGLTDQEGYFEFVPDQSGAWEIKVRQAGHGALVTMAWPPETTLASKQVMALGGGNLAVNRPGLGLPRWLGLGLGVAGCLGGAWLAMRRSPQSSRIEVAD